MATVKEHVLLSQPDKLVLLSEIPAADPCDSLSTTTIRLLVELCSDYGDGPVDAETMEDVACRVPITDLGRYQGAAEQAFKELVARIDPVLRPEVATETRAAAARVRARCGDQDELAGVEFRLRVMFIDVFEGLGAEDDESGSDMEFGEFDLSGARNLHHPQASVDYEHDDDDEDGCAAQFSVRPYHGAGGPGNGNLLLSGFNTRSDGPDLTEQRELTSYDIGVLYRNIV